MTQLNTQNMNTEELFAPAKAVEPYMQDFINNRPFPENLKQAILYSLLGPGKRLRPILVLRSAESVGGNPQNALPAASAIEMIHCFSLIHDDLPSMDDDDLRRGRPTLHKQTNEAMAILAGDALNTLAFEIIATQVKDDALANKLNIELTTATNNMIAGQIYDSLPDFPDNLTPIEQLRLIHRNKTGALIRASCRMGAIAANASEEQLEALTRYGEAIGLMFQVIDDLLDITQTTEQLGKTAGKDIEQDKLTYPAIMGIEKSKEVVSELHQQAIESLSILGDKAQHLIDLCDYMSIRQK